MIYMYMREPGEGAAEPEPVSWPVRAIVGVLVLLILFLGIHPDKILALAGSSSLALK
jgi:hypothetical protein